MKDITFDLNTMEYYKDEENKQFIEPKIIHLLVLALKWSQNPDCLRKNLAFVAPFFQHLGFDIEKAGNEFTAFQIILATFTEKRSVEENLLLIREKDWPNIEMIFMDSFCLPLDNAMSERGFITMNYIKTSKRNKLMDVLFALMLLSIYEKGFRF